MCGHITSRKTVDYYSHRAVTVSKLVTHDIKTSTYSHPLFTITFRYGNMYIQNLTIDDLVDLRGLLDDAISDIELNEGKDYAAK